jgi:hypothetical protein
VQQNPPCKSHLEVNMCCGYYCNCSVFLGGLPEPQSQDISELATGSKAPPYTHIAVNGDTTS